MLGFCPLASGSKGNTLYIGTDKTKILIDAGISGKGIKERLDEIDVAIEDIDAIMISHEHFDHIQGLKVLAFKLNIPIIANHETAKAICDYFHDCPKFKIFTTGEPFEFEDLYIQTFRVKHDAAEPVGFRIHWNDIVVGICTDLGVVTNEVQRSLTKSDILYVEANHRPSMVHASSRPQVYKDRVLSTTGHLSNEASGELISKVYHEELKHVYLAHLSSECNTPDVALHDVGSILERNNITVPLTIAHQERRSRPTLFR
jgi:phosphoribosyl 1,2-cyclic phosphodiesterase